MATVHLALQDGFDGDTVSVRVDGREAYRREGVTTRTQISLAEAVELEVGAGRHALEVAVESRGLRETIEVDAAVTPNVTVSVREGRLAVRFPERIGFA